MKIALRVGVAVVTAAALVPYLIPAASADPGTWYTGFDGGAPAAEWTATTDGPQPYSDIVADLSVPIEMSDGVTLKADITHPAVHGQMAPGQRPTILQIQGYGKQAITLAQGLMDLPGIEEVLFPFIAQFNFDGTAFAGITNITRQLSTGIVQSIAQSRQLARGGYTLVQVDLRGTGASEGAWQLFAERERQDSQEVIDWIAAQPWSDGNVGTMGASMTAITALQATDRGNPHLKANFGVVPSSDIMSDIAAPGGGIGFAFLPIWLLAVNLSKMLPDVASIVSGRWDTAQQLQWLRDRIADPATYLDVVANGYGSTSIGQLTQKARDIFTPGSPFRRGMVTDLAAVSAPVMMVAGWFDIFGSTPAETFNGLSKLSPEQKKIIIGDGYHAAPGILGFGDPGMPPRLDVLQRAWFDKWLKGIDNGIEHFSPLTLRQQGGGWRTDFEFPNRDVTYRRMYLHDISSGTAPHAVIDGGLSAEPRQTTVRDLTVAPSLLSLCSRDTARISGGATSIVLACTEDSRIWEHSGLTFTSGPVGTPTAVSGPIAVHLNVVHDAADGFWVVTVNDVAPDGNSREISTGQLTASLRQVDPVSSTTSANGDYTAPEYYIDLARREPTLPGQPVTLDIALTPIEAVLQPGHRLRVDVYAGNFPKGLPPTPIMIDTALQPEHVRLDPNAPSWVNIAVDTDIPG
ncbi:CocE/NonD family hydrolase [Nocardia vulneris]|uniref:CocE/NonD family hydrolase n=1 Tax=Nocardia vulneris TaxID=1141657 RepID=UPI0030CBDA47